MIPSLNPADDIVQQLHEDGHRTWGLTIYRCTYESDEDWEEFMRRSRFHIEKTLKGCGRPDLLDSLTLTVFDDEAVFDGASTSLVRENFRRWTSTAPQHEQDTGPGDSLRYRFCIQIDHESLRSVVYDSPAPPALDPRTVGFVKLIKEDWEATTPHPRESENRPIEGSTLHDVGWMKVAYTGMMVGVSYYLRELDAWYREYRRPPEFARLE